MKDLCQREIEYLRVSVTDRCNLRCQYCMPLEGVKTISHGDILRNEEIGYLVKIASKLGIRRVRLTGGEPLIRKGIANLVELLADIKGIEEVSLTTNGILLPQMASDLKKAGLKRVNISLDTLDPKKYRDITRVGDFSKVWQGIENALAYELNPVKLNVVAIRGFNDKEILDFARLTLTMPLQIRFIEIMPLGIADSWARDKQISCDEIKRVIENTFGFLNKVESVTGVGPAQYYSLPSAKGDIGFISPISNHFCNTCNRLRLTAEGNIRFCLFSQDEIDLKTPLRNQEGEQVLVNLWKEAILKKPSEHNLEKSWTKDDRVMSQIGG